MSDNDTEQPVAKSPRREIRITTTMTAFFFVAVLAVIIVGWLNSEDDDVVLTESPVGPTTTAYESKSALPTDQDMVKACHDVLEARMASNRATGGEVMWNTADVAPSAKYPGYYDVTGTGTLDDGVQTPFAFTCLVDFGPPTVAVDNGFKLRP